MVLVVDKCDVNDNSTVNYDVYVVVCIDNMVITSNEEKRSTWQGDTRHPYYVPPGYVTDSNIVL